MRTRGAAALEMRRLSDFELEIETPVETDGSDGESGEDPFWPYGEEEVEGGVDQSEEGEEEDEIHSVRIVQQVKKCNLMTTLQRENPRTMSRRKKAIRPSPG